MRCHSTRGPGNQKFESGIFEIARKISESFGTSAKPLRSQSGQNHDVSCLIACDLTIFSYNHKQLVLIYKILLLEIYSSL